MTLFAKRAVIWTALFLFFAAATAVASSERQRLPATLWAVAAIFSAAKTIYWWQESGFQVFDLGAGRRWKRRLKRTEAWLHRWWSRY